ncbi:MAG: hypothetical protein Q8P40_01900 [Nitrospirota bacterium]|nr:hypothetical protein [Nitrospirota bacterium]
MTDKEVYYSNETMLVSLEIFSEDDIKNVRVNVSGIENTFGRSMIEDSRVVSLKKGNNTIDFVFKTPSCEECSALSPGSYMINATVEIETDSFMKNISKPVILQREKDRK